MKKRDRAKRSRGGEGVSVSPAQRDKSRRQAEKRVGAVLGGFVRQKENL